MWVGMGVAGGRGGLFEEGVGEVGVGSVFDGGVQGIGTGHDC